MLRVVRDYESWMLSILIAPCTPAQALREAPTSLTRGLHGHYYLRRPLTGYSVRAVSTMYVLEPIRHLYVINGRWHPMRYLSASLAYVARG